MNRASTSRSDPRSAGPAVEAAGTGATDLTVTSHWDVEPLLRSPADPMVATARLTWCGATEAELVIAQVHAVDAWLRAVRQDRPDLRSPSRQSQVERNRLTETLACVSTAIRSQVEPVPARSVRAHSGVPGRVVIAHRHDWFASKLSTSFADRGLTVTCRVQDGAAILGVAIAEQPDLLLLQDPLVRIPAEVLLPQIRRFAPRTVVAIQVDCSQRALVLHESGAHAPFDRYLPPAEVATALVALLEACSLSASDSPQRTGGRVDHR